MGQTLQHEISCCLDMALIKLDQFIEDKFLFIDGHSLVHCVIFPLEEVSTREPVPCLLLYNVCYCTNSVFCTYLERMGKWFCLSAHTGIAACVS